MQSGGKVASDTFSRFVEGDQHKGGVNRTATARSGPDEDKLDFWDDFAEAGESYQKTKVEPERKDFWDDFAAAGETLQTKKKPEPERKEFWDEFASIGGGAGTSAAAAPPKSKSSVGTAAIKRTPAGGGAKGDEWDNW